MSAVTDVEPDVDGASGEASNDGVHSTTPTVLEPNYPNNNNSERTVCCETPQWF